MLGTGMHDIRIANWLSVWQLKGEDDGEGLPNFAS